MRIRGRNLAQYVNELNVIDVPSVEELMKRPLAKFITFFANDYGYSGSAKDLIVNWVHPLI